ncbi:MAG: hypothetical protein GY699_03785 [Desulfobacteraceae bacterium]|nr:hypothetical protein [Desulfobacteraceae bacterium]
MAKCWICNKNEASTGEHIFKHSILRDMYGEKSFEKGDRLIVCAPKIYNGRTVPSTNTIQSTDADIFKLKKSLCSYCNGAKSREWDDEFDVSIRYLFDNYRKSLSNGYVNLNIAHAKCSTKDTRNLYNYFCKLFGCKLYTNGHEVPEEIINAVNGLNCPNVLGMNIVYDQKYSRVRKDLSCHPLRGYSGDVLSYKWAFGFGPIIFYFWYKTPKEFIVGKQWFGKSKRIPFTYYQSLNRHC